MKWFGTSPEYPDPPQTAEDEVKAVFRERAAQYNDVLKYQGPQAAAEFEADTRGIVRDLFKKARKGR
jgi:hypothetical protein